MSRDEFEESLGRGIDRRAAEQVARGVWTKDEAARASQGEFAELLPQGPETPGRTFYRVVDAANGTRVGEVWCATETKGGRTHVGLHWIWIDPAFRRRGFATQVLERMRADAARAGADWMGLHVVADNAPAIALYAKAGYQPASLRMARRVRDP